MEGGEGEVKGRTNIFICAGHEDDLAQHPHYSKCPFVPVPAYWRVSVSPRVRAEVNDVENHGPVRLSHDFGEPPRIRLVLWH